jgi:pimeloyl-ACP methyl ester carboxylesterase
MNEANAIGTRHRFLRSLIISLATGVLGASIIGTTQSQAQLAPIPIPAQAAAKEGWVELADTRLWYWDTGGNGPAIVLLHPATGSGLIWSYQQPVFAKAGYRVIAYSRRGYYNSAPYEPNKAGVGSEDLRALADNLGLQRFHVVASAAGGSVAADFALSYPERLLTLSISSNSFGVRDGAIAKAADFIRPKGWDDLAPEFRELGPSYRAMDPEGVRQWVELEHKAHVSSDYRQRPKNQMTEAKLKEFKPPTLVINGAADLSTPPSIGRMLVAEIPGSELVVAPESGHSVYWEQPDVFNRAVLDFVGRHSK